MKSFFIFLFVLGFSFYSSAQQTDLRPGIPGNFMPIDSENPIQANGLELSYKILSTQNKEVGKKGEFDRYEIMLQAVNQQSCDYMIWLTGRERSTSASNFPLAEFRCLNATGYRLTAKAGTITPQPRLVPYKTSVKGADGKMVENITQVLAGFQIRGGGMLENRIIVIVPQGEKPQFEVRLYTYPQF